MILLLIVGITVDYFSRQKPSCFSPAATLDLANRPSTLNYFVTFPLDITNYIDKGI